MSYPVHHDRSSDRRMLRAVLLFALAMLCVGGSLAWTISSGPQNPDTKEAGGPQSVSVCCSLLLVFASVPYVFYARLRMGLLYRCPKCGTRIKSPLPTSEEDGARVRHRCDRCRITWDTGWTYSRGGD